MSDADLAGTWDLIGVAQVQAQARLIGEDTDPADVDDWLNERDDRPLPPVEVATGPRLRIDAERFDEQRTGTPDVPWFDAEGVLAEEAAPFGGTMSHLSDRAYLAPKDTPGRAAPMEGRHGPAILRYDDGDTKIADAVRVVEGQLIRTVSVVTDELYLNRVALIYARAGD